MCRSSESAEYPRQLFLKTFLLSPKFYLLETIAPGSRRYPRVALPFFPRTRHKPRGLHLPLVASQSSQHVAARLAQKGAYTPATLRNVAMCYGKQRRLLPEAVLWSQ